MSKKIACVFDLFAYKDPLDAYQDPFPDEYPMYSQVFRRTRCGSWVIGCEEYHHINDDGTAVYHYRERKISRKEVISFIRRHLGEYGAEIELNGITIELYGYYPGSIPIHLGELGEIFPELLKGR